MYQPIPQILTLKIEQQIKPPDDSAEIKNEQARSLFIQQAYKQGGQLFLKAIEQYGRTEKGEKPILRRWYRESLLAIGDLRLPEVLTSGNAQCGKTLSHTWFITWIVTEGRLNAGWFYASRDSRELNVPEQFRPVVECWVAEKESQTKTKIAKSSDRHLNSRYQVAGATAIFSYVSTSKSTPSRAGLAKAGGAAVSFTANALIYEERSQWPIGCADPLPRRLDASKLPTKPIRQLGTPGAGQGIEAEFKKSDRHFYPHYTCKRCNQTHPLDPKGCLLRQVTRQNALGKQEKSYFSESGRPALWWHKDENSPVESAYIGCSNCGIEIPDSDRRDAWMQCRRTGEKLIDFIEALDNQSGYHPWKIGVHFSPLVREVQSNLAADLIRQGRDCDDTTDWQQQALGHPSEHQIASLTQEMLVNAMGLPAPRQQPDFVLAGIDVGRSEDWLMIVNFYLPHNWQQMEPAIAMEKTIRQVVFGGGVIRDDIPDYLKDYGVQFGLIDNEPDRETAMRLCRQTCLNMADQKVGFNQIVKQEKVLDGGKEFPCWFIRSDKFLLNVLEGFLLPAPDGRNLYRLPESWRKWVGNPGDRSPLVHLTGPSRNPASGQWQRGPRNVDDLYYAAMFVEAAFYIKFALKQKSGFEMWSSMVTLT